MPMLNTVNDTTKLFAEREGTQYMVEFLREVSVFQGAEYVR